MHRHPQFQIDVPKRVMQAGGRLPKDVCISANANDPRNFSERRNRAWLGSAAAQLETSVKIRRSVGLIEFCQGGNALENAFG
jgi:hypothetical protein